MLVPNNTGTHRTVWENYGNQGNMTGLGLAGGIGALSGLAQSAFGIFGQKRAQEHDEKLAAAQRAWSENMWQKQSDWSLGQWNREKDFNLEMWHLQNAYNSPQAQMQRFKEAGLNPHLIYGKGSPGNAGSLAAPRAAQPDVKPYNRAQSRNIFEGIKGFQDIYQFRNLNAQTNNLKAQTDVANQQAYNLSVDALSKALDLDIKGQTKDSVVALAKHNADIAGTKAESDRLQLDILENTKQETIDTVKQNLALLKQDTSVRESQAIIAKAKANLAKDGIVGDSAAYIIMGILKGLGFSVNDIKGLIDSFKNPINFITK